MNKRANPSAGMDIDDAEVAERTEFMAQESHADQIVKAFQPRAFESTAQISQFKLLNYEEAQYVEHSVYNSRNLQTALNSVSD